MMSSDKLGMYSRAKDSNDDKMYKNRKSMSQPPDIMVRFFKVIGNFMVRRTSWTKYLWLIYNF